MFIDQFQLLQQPVDVVMGELIFCLRQANPGQSIRGFRDPVSNFFEYCLFNSEDSFTDPGDAGVISIWPVGSQTYLQQIPPRRPGAREASANILAGWFRSRGRWPDQCNQLLPAGVRLVRELMNHFDGNKAEEIVFESPVPQGVLMNFCVAIQTILSAALCCEMGNIADQVGLIPLIEQTVYDWARSRYSPSDPPDAA